MVRVRVGRDIAKGHRVIAGLLDLAARISAGGVAVEQYGGEHLRVIGLGACLADLLGEAGEVQLPDDLHHKVRQVIGR